MHSCLQIEIGIPGGWPVCAHAYWPENAGRGVLGPFGPFEGPLSPTDGGVRGELGRLEAERKWSCRIRQRGYLRAPLAPIAKWAWTRNEGAFGAFQPCKLFGGECATQCGRFVLEHGRLGGAIQHKVGHALAKELVLLVGPVVGILP